MKHRQIDLPPVLRRPVESAVGSGHPPGPEKRLSMVVHCQRGGNTRSIVATIPCANIYGLAQLNPACFRHQYSLQVQALVALLLPEPSKVISWAKSHHKGMISSII